MNREVITKVFMVSALLGGLALTVKLAMEAQKAEQARKVTATTEAPQDPEQERRTKIRDAMARAIQLHRQLDFEGAERLLRRTSERYPRVPAVWLNLGICLRSLNKLDEADRAFARVLQLNDEDWDAVAERATIRVLRGDADEAFALLQQVPANKGQVYERLRSDPDWKKYRDDPRMTPLRAKHGVVADRDTSLQQTESVLRRREENERSSALAPTSTVAKDPQP